MAKTRSRPLIGITADVGADKLTSGRSYAAMVAQAGGAPIILPPIISCIEQYLAATDAIIFSGGDDPITTHWGVPLHPQAKPVHPDRQEFELALLNALAQQPKKPVLGICLGMQLMGLHAGGRLDQHLADTLPTAHLHWDKRAHEVRGELGNGIVHSHHRQALTDAGRLRTIATSPDGVIEAVQCDDRPFYFGVQWHPERTEAHQLGLDLIRRLVEAASKVTVPKR
jgi:putative glutamine amidotransferase